MPGTSAIASAEPVRYRSGMKCGLKNLRCPTEGFRRLQFAPAPCAAGFSSIELLAVIAILILLFVLLWGPRVGDNRQRQAQKDCQNQLQKIYMAMEIYANDHAGKFPETPGARSSEEALDVLVPRYTVDTAVFICPGSKDPPLPAGESFRQHKISYAYYMGRRAAEAQAVLLSDAQVDAGARKAGDYAFSSTGKPPGNNHGKLGGNFLFCDGHAESVPARVPFAVGLTQGVVLLNPHPK
jgi:prepilin-type processing-associated H-X9-DG protein